MYISETTHSHWRVTLSPLAYKLCHSFISLSSDTLEKSPYLRVRVRHPNSSNGSIQSPIAPVIKISEHRFLLRNEKLPFGDCPRGPPTCYVSVSLYLARGPHRESEVAIRCVFVTAPVFYRRGGSTDDDHCRVLTSGHRFTRGVFDQFTLLSLSLGILIRVLNFYNTRA